MVNINLNKFFCLMVLIVGLLFGHAQDPVTLQFTGQNQHGQHVPLTTVLVENTTKHWQEVLYYPDTILFIGHTGVEEIEQLGNGVRLFQNVPNPFNGVTDFALQLTEASDVQLEIYDLNGKVTATYQGSLDPGCHQFRAWLAAPQTYLLQTRTDDGTVQIKMLNTGKAGQNRIAYIGNGNTLTVENLKSDPKGNINMPFNYGDIMSYIGHAHLANTEFTSETLMKAQYNSELLPLIFTLPLPTVTTEAATNIYSTEAWLNGSVIENAEYPVTERGFLFADNEQLTEAVQHLAGTGDGNFHYSVQDLQIATRYYYRAYAQTALGISYGDVRFFDTQAEMPVVQTFEVENITPSSATCSGEVTADGGANVTARGICWNTSQNPTMNDSHTSEGTGIGYFSSNITGLTAGTTYYVRAYATNSVGTAYGQQTSFTALALPTVSTSTVTNITVFTATCGGEVIADGGTNVTTCGVCWSTSQNPTINNSHTFDGSGIGSFTSDIVGLSPNITYYVRAYATNSVGTAYGQQTSFTTLANLPEVSTSSVTNITSSSATCGGNVISDGGDIVTARGICWSTSQNPTLNDSYSSDGIGTGYFFSNITGLTAGTTYYVRAYATNSAGTAYGQQTSFTALALPTVSTSTVTNITASTAICGGHVTGTGGSNVTARGVCWSTSQNPTINNSHTFDGSDIGSFTSQIVGLSSNTTYYVRAYATNSVGTTYGEELFFTTEEIVIPADNVQPCPGIPTVTDHEGNVYNTLKVGTQCWTKENMRAVTSPSTGTYLIPAAGISYTFTGKQARWYNNDSTTYAPQNYGLLYNWNAAMDTFNTAYGEASVNTSYSNAVSVSFTGHRRGICPQGWHVPSNAEWTVFTDYVGSQSEYTCGGNSSYIAKALSSTEGWNSDSCDCCPGNQSGMTNNATGFSAVPAGGYYISSFDNAGYNAGFWSSTQNNGPNAWYRNLFYITPSVAGNDFPSKGDGYSVRCLRDAGITIPDAQPCPGTSTVIDHEGNVYNTVKIGTQCWTKENMRAVTSPSTGTYLIPAADIGNTLTGKQARWYNNDSATYAPQNYGLLYNWNAAVDTFNTTYGETSVNTINSVSVSFTGHRRGICPQGWHVPSNLEWGMLKNYVGRQSEYTCGGYSYNIAKALSSTEGWNSDSCDCCPGNQGGIANNVTGFSAVPAGGCNSYYDSLLFDDAGYNTCFRSTTQVTQNPWSSHSFYLFYNNPTVNDQSNITSINGYSVRCLRNTGITIFDAQPCPSTPTVTDHEGNVYNTVQIGEQCWMRENLRTTTSPSTGTYLIPAAGTSYTFTGKQARWYNNDPATYAPQNYGLLYNWNAATDTFNTAFGETSVNGNSSNAVYISERRRGICPAGWHLPDKGEWATLANYVSCQSEYMCNGNSSYFAKALASTEGWNNHSGVCCPGDQSVTANNATGFSAVPAGYCKGSPVYSLSFSSVGNNAYFWTSNSHSPGTYGDAWCCYLNYANADAVASIYNSTDYKSYGFSVRCLRD